MKLKSFDIDIRPMKNKYGIPNTEVPKDSFHVDSNGIWANNRYYSWESLLEVRIRPTFEEEDEA